MTVGIRDVLPVLRALLLGFSSVLSVSCGIFYEARCDMSPEGSVWLTVVRLSEAQDKFYKAHGRYGELRELTGLVDGLSTETTSGRMGSYAISIELNNAGYILRANPDFPRVRSGLSSFYADQTGLITYDRSGRPATPNSTKM